MELGRIWLGVDCEEERPVYTSWHSFSQLFQAEIPSFSEGGFNEGLRFGGIFTHQFFRIPIELFFGSEGVVGQ